jgi:hypothetical protein
MMSDSTPTGVPDEAADATEDTDRLVGRYTEVDGEGPEVRGVAGEYTRTDGVADDESVEGDYTSTAEHPDEVDPSERHGKYIRTEPPKPHPGKHHV